MMSTRRFFLKVLLSFDPIAIGGYVWRFNIVKHEDNEMMRLNEVQPNPKAPTGTYIKGVDY
jgi:hypothetical protein